MNKIKLLSRLTLEFLRNISSHHDRGLFSVHFTLLFTVSGTSTRGESSHIITSFYWTNSKVSFEQKCPTAYRQTYRFESLKCWTEVPKERIWKEQGHLEKKRKSGSRSEEPWGRKWGDAEKELLTLADVLRGEGETTLRHSTCQNFIKHAVHS